jgi:coenzyme F420-0:L-glutamate ligase/coenzyme F420-1:gamma-L-glutamate ligase
MMDRAGAPSPSEIGCGGSLEVRAVPGIPIVRPGDDLPALVEAALVGAGMRPATGDVIVVPSKVVSRAEGRFVDLAAVVASPRSVEVAKRCEKDPRVVEVILNEAKGISRIAKNVLVVRHRLGFIAANAGIDQSNAAPPDAPAGSGPWILLLPTDPDASAARLRAHLEARFEACIGVIVSDSFGRPFRLGTVGAAIGIAGVPALWDQRGGADLFGRRLEITITALGDQIAAAADLVAGQAAEGRGAVLVRGITWPPGEHSANEILRNPDEDLYA